MKIKQDLMSIQAWTNFSPNPPSLAHRCFYQISWWLNKFEHVHTANRLQCYPVHQSTYNDQFILWRSMSNNTFRGKGKRTHGFQNQKFGFSVLILSSTINNSHKPRDLWLSSKHGRLQSAITTSTTRPPKKELPATQLANRITRTTAMTRAIKQKMSCPKCQI